jgi:hypothetical protein
MPKKDEPMDKVKLTLYFDTKQGRSNFLAWYLDGGGEQGSHYYTRGNWTEEWIYLAPPETACPKCEYSFDEDEINGFFWDNKSIMRKTFKCGNCGHKYNIENIYSKDPS